MSIKRTDLEKLAAQLRAALAIIEAELEEIVVPPEIAAEVKRKMDARICLAWDHPIPEGEESYRGRCKTDYSLAMQRIARGQESERDLMMRGELGPPGKRGRRAASDLEKAAKQKKVAEDLEAYKKRKAKGKADE